MKKAEKSDKKVYDHSINLDSETRNQFKQCYSQKFVLAAALMPDAHRGYVAPIGSVFITKDFIVPAWVGYDIGCGMIAVKISGKNILESIKDNPEKIYKAVKTAVPMGLGGTNKKHPISEESRKKFLELLEKFKSKEHDKSIYNFIRDVGLRDLGTLGAGNHFISLNEEEGQKNNDFAWLVIHCGSRGLGHRVAKKYMIKSSLLKGGGNVGGNLLQKGGGNVGGNLVPLKFEKTFPLNVNSDVGKEYLNLLDFGLEYALLNRIEISRRIVRALEEIFHKNLKSELWVNKTHNHAIEEKGKFVHRKGATPAKRGERGLIPGNMRDGSFLVKGKGNKGFLNSSSHGAGRAMSRTQAKKEIKLENFKREMKGIKTNFIIDEAPEAYKNIFDVMEKQKSSVKILKHLKPIINWQESSNRGDY